MLDLGRAVQKLYLPEFLPDPGRPLSLPGTGEKDRAPGVSECYGTLRYGKLLEALLYESRRFTTLTGADAVMIGRDLIRAAVGGGAEGVRLHMEFMRETLVAAMRMTDCPDLGSVGPHILC